MTASAPIAKIERPSSRYIEPSLLVRLIIFILLPPHSLLSQVLHTAALTVFRPRTSKQSLPPCVPLPLRTDLVPPICVLPLLQLLCPRLSILVWDLVLNPFTTFLRKVLPPPPSARDTSSITFLPS